MTHQGLLLLLDGPLQAWGTQSRFGHRDTDFEPSKSGVIGLIGAALGMSREDDETLARLATLSMAVRVDREGRVLRDYHTVGGGTYRGQPHGVFGTNDTVVTNRHYLMDACFVVGVAGEDHGLIERIGAAVRNPRWPLFLGRRSCPPARSVYLGGPFQGAAGELIRRTPWQVPRASLDSVSLRCVIEGDDGKPRADVPRSFRLYARRFDTRFVRETWLPVAELPGGQHVSDSTAVEQPIT